MKKILVAVMAVAAIGFTSCNNKTGKTDVAVDSTSMVETMAPAELAGVDADNLTKDLAEKIAANNPEAVKAVIEQAKEKIAEYLAKGDAEAAKIYQEKINAFLTENADKIKAVVGSENEAVNSLISAIAATPTNVADAAEGAVDAAATAVEDKAEEVKGEAKKKVEGAIDDAAADAKKKLGL
jgi:hypothetical protein